MFAGKTGDKITRSENSSNSPVIKEPAAATPMTSGSLFHMAVALAANSFCSIIAKVKNYQAEAAEEERISFIPPRPLHSSREKK